MPTYNAKIDIPFDVHDFCTDGERVELDDRITDLEERVDEISKEFSQKVLAGPDKSLQDYCSELEDRLNKLETGDTRTAIQLINMRLKDVYTLLRAINREVTNHLEAFDS